VEHSCYVPLLFFTQLLLVQPCDEAIHEHGTVLISINPLGRISLSNLLRRMSIPCLPGDAMDIAGVGSGNGTLNLSANSHDEYIFLYQVNKYEVIVALCYGAVNCLFFSSLHPSTDELVHRLQATHYSSGSSHS
jgi:hypothetical protein